MATKPSTGARLDRAQWIDAALEAIEAGGPDAVAVVPLARRLGVTKGSFYWHFADRRELLRAALDAWLERHTAEPEERFGAIRDPGERLRSLFRHAMVEGRPTVIVQLLAHLDDPDVAATVEQATDRRVELLSRAYRELGLRPGEARNQALLAYCAFLGFAQLTREQAQTIASGRDAQRLYRTALRALVEVPESGR